MEKIVKEGKYGTLIEETNGGNEEITVGLKVHTHLGDMYAYPSPDIDHPGICLTMVPKGTDEEIDLAMVETHEDKDFDLSDKVYIYEWGDVYTDEWTDHQELYYADMVSALDINPEE